MTGDIWAIRPSVGAAIYRAAAAITGDAPITLPLLVNDPAPQGAGYLVTITSNGDDRAVIFTITGRQVGDITGGSTVETIAGPNAAAVTGTIPFASISSITASAASANNISIGTIGNLFLPRARIKGFYVVSGANAGTLVVNIGTASVINTIFSIATPGGVTITNELLLPGDGILTARQVNDFAEVIATGITDYTLFCG